MIINYLIKNWILMILVSFLLGVNFIIPRSDSAPSSFVLIFTASTFSFICWFSPNLGSPDLINRTIIYWLLGLFLTFALVTCLPLMASILKYKTEINGGIYDESGFWIELIKLCGLGIGFMGVFRLASFDSAARRVYDVILATGSLWAFISIIMFIIDPNGIYGILKSAGSGRLTGTFSSPNSAATLFGTLAVLTFGRFLKRLEHGKSGYSFDKIHPLYTLCLIINLTALTMTLSRGGIIATLIAMLILGINMSWQRATLLQSLFLGATGAVSAIFLFATPLLTTGDRLNNLNSDTQTRQNIFSAHLNIAEHSPWYGNGLGSFSSINNSIINEGNYNDLWPIGAAHNVYIQWYEEGGIASLVVLLFLHLVLAYTFIMAILRRKRMGERVLSISCAYLVILIHGLSDYAFQEPAIAIYATCLLGLATAISTNSERYAA